VEEKLEKWYEEYITCSSYFFFFLSVLVVSLFCHREDKQYFDATVYTELKAISFT